MDPAPFIAAFQHGVPCTTREETQSALNHLVNNPNIYNDATFGDGPLLLSDIPLSAVANPIVIGIDEAGRGPALGPMIYAAAYWPAVMTLSAIAPSGMTDSKVLTSASRSSMLQQLLQSTDFGFAVRVLPASEISRNMLRRPVPYNLNAMSHDAAMAMIRAIVARNNNVVVTKCYVDTVGDPASYQRQLEQAFPGIEFCVEAKADASYPVCSAASIVAKVIRDGMLQNWKADETLADLDFGSGYPSDPKCKAWMERNLHDRVFGYSNPLVRFSWNPIRTALTKSGRAIEVSFAADVDDEEQPQQYEILQQRMKSFLSGSAEPESKRKKLKLPYFEKLGLSPVTKLGLK